MRTMETTSGKKLQVAIGRAAETIKPILDDRIDCE